MLIGAETLAAIAATGEPDLPAAAAILAAPGPAEPRMRAARDLFTGLRARPKDHQRLTADIVNAAKVAPAARAALAALALDTAPEPGRAADAILTTLPRFRPASPPTAEEAAQARQLIAAAERAGLAELAAALTPFLRGEATLDAALPGLHTPAALWRLGRAAAAVGDAALHQAAVRRYRDLHPYAREDRRTTRRALILNLRPELGGASLRWVHNHSNFPQSYAAAKRGDRVAMDALFVEDLRRIPPAVAAPHHVINNIGAPEALTEARIIWIEELAKGLDAPLINPPRKVAALTRDALPGLLRDPALTAPETLRLPADLAPDAAREVIAASLAPPLILRDAQRHMGVGAHLAADWDGVADALAKLAGAEIMVSRFHDLRGANGLYVKARVFLIGGALIPDHIYTAADWNVHRKATLALDRARPELKALDRWRGFREDPLAETPAPVWRALRAALTATGLDVVGADYTMLPDGRAMVFEMNPAMRIQEPSFAAFERLLGARPPKQDPWADRDWAAIAP